MRLILGVATSLLLACTPSGPVLDETSCPECAIELEHVVTLDLKDAPSSPWIYSSLHHLPDGSWAVTWSYHYADVMRFNPDGSYRDVLMPRGEGPGEAKSIQAAWVSGDTLWVWDTALYRCSGFVDDALVAEHKCESAAYDVLPMDQGVAIRGPLLYSTTLRYLDGHGWDERRVTFFGPDTLTWDIGAMTPARGGGVWWTSGRSYRIEQWAPGEAQPRRIIGRSPAWWRTIVDMPVDIDRSAVASGEVPRLPEPLAGPLLWSIWQNRGILWTSSYVTRDPQTTVNDWMSQHTEGRVHTIIEALTDDGKLLAVRLDSIGIAKFTNDGLLFVPEVHAAGHINLKVYRPRIFVPEPNNHSH